MLRSILFSFRLDLASELVPFGCILGSVWNHFGSILAPFLFQLGSILEPFGFFRGVLWRKSSRVEPRAARGIQRTSILNVFGRKRGPRGFPKSIKNRWKIDAKINGKFGWVLAEPWEGFWLTLGMFLGPWTLDFECFVWARCFFSKFRFFMFGLTF